MAACVRSRLAAAITPRPRVSHSNHCFFSHLAARKTSSNTGTASHRPQAVMYDGKTFSPIVNAANGEVGEETRFHYHQNGTLVWAEYAGGSIVKGSLIATILNEVGELDMRYHHVNLSGELMTGRCHSVPEKLSDGRLRLHEEWQWTSGDCSSGESVIEEIKG